MAKKEEIKEELTEDFSVVFSKEAAEKLKTAPPEIQEVMRSLAASMRQAMQGVQDGTYKSFPDAMEAITGHRPQRMDSEDFDEEFREGDD